MITNKRLFITGGAGYLGKAIVARYYDTNDITVYSRDEAKHYYLKKMFPRINCVIGDIRNYDLMLRHSRKHDIGIFAASLKQIEAVDQNVEEAVHVIVDGAINSRRIAEENEFEAACFISSDKSRAATTLYGSMKFLAGESFIVNAGTGTRLSTAIYGNVLNSTGSIIPLIWDSIRNSYPLQLYSDQMTRFFIDIDSAVTLIETALDTSGFNVIPNLKSFRIVDLFEIYSEKFGLKYNLTSPRISEKLHETMIAKEEIPRTIYDANKDIFLMHYKNVYNQQFPWTEFSSEHTIISKQELYSILQHYNFFAL